MLDDDDDYDRDDDDYAPEEPFCFDCVDTGLVKARLLNRIMFRVEHRPCPYCVRPDWIDRLTVLRRVWAVLRWRRRGAALDEQPF